VLLLDALVVYLVSSKVNDMSASVKPSSNGMWGWIRKKYWWPARRCIPVFV